MATAAESPAGKQERSSTAPAKVSPIRHPVGHIQVDSKGSAYLHTEAGVRKLDQSTHQALAAREQMHAGLRAQGVSQVVKRVSMLWIAVDLVIAVAYVWYRHYTG